MTDEEIKNIKEFLRLEKIDELDNSEEMLEEVFREAIKDIVNEPGKKEE